MPFIFRSVSFTVLLCIFYNICLSQQPRLMLPVGHRGNIAVAGFSPDGNKVFTNGADNTYKIWDSFTGTLLYDLNLFGSLEANQYLVTPVQFSPDNKMFLSVSKNRYIEEYYPDMQNDDIRNGTYEKDTFKIWNAFTGKLIFKYAGNGTSRFSRDNKMIAIAVHPDITKLFDIDKGKLLATLQNKNQKHDPETWQDNSIIEFSPDGKKLISLSDYTRIGLWNISTRTYKQLDYLKAGIGEGSVIGGTFSPDSKKLICFTKATEGNEHDNIKAFNPETGALLFKINCPLGSSADPFFSPDGKNIIVNTDLKFNPHEGVARMFDAATGKEITDITGKKEKCSALFYSPDKTTIAYVITDSMIMIKKAGSAEPVLILHGQEGQEGFVKVEFSSDSKKIMAVCTNNTVKTWDTGNGNLLAQFELPESPFYTDINGMVKINEPLISPESGKIISFSTNGEAQVWNAVTGKRLSTLKGHTSAFKARFNEEGDKVILTSDSVTKVWNLHSGVLVNLPAGSLKDPEDNIQGFGERIKYSFDRKKLLYFDKFSDNNEECPSITIYTNDQPKTDSLRDSYPLSNQKILGHIKGHTDWITSAQFSPNGKFILTSSMDYTVKLWDADNYKLVLTLFTIDSTDYLVQTPSGYYQSTPNAAKKLHYITSDQKSIGFEQLDIKYNRPDKIFTALDNTDSVLISTYRNAYYKRIKKLGVDTTAFMDGYSLPESDIANRNNIARETTQEMLALHLKGTDNSYSLNSFNVWVNEVPVYGQRGVSISNKKSGNFDSTVTIQLSQGENKIEFSVTNTNGTESYRMPLTVNYTPDIKKDEKVYFIGIGIDKFADTTYNLHYCTKDIRDLSFKMKTKFKNSMIIDTLFNQDVTIDKIKSLKNKLLQTTVNDRVIISYSGHGMISKSYDYYLSTYSVKFNDPKENGLPYEDLENLLDNIPARKKLMLIDACHSGEIDKGDYQLTKTKNELLASNHVVSRGVIVTNTDTSAAKIGLGNSFELMQHIFVNVGKSTGATIISAAAGTEFALEKGDLKNGVFTYCIMETMEKYPTLKISDLKRIVGTRVEELTGGSQRPTSRNEVISVNWDLW